MKERPILFNGAMVRAILEGRKVQTRRVMKPQPCLATDSDGQRWWLVDFESGERGYGWEEHNSPFWTRCPYGITGDRMWVRETFLLEDNREYFGDAEFAPPHDGRPIQHHARVNEYDREHDLIPRYRATESDFALECEHGDCNEALGPCMHPWRPSIFMPRWASRITLEITDVRVQRLQEISEEDAAREGADEPSSASAQDVADIQISDASPTIKALARALGPGSFTHKFMFQHLWDSINAKRGFGWDKNPWVWAITFRRAV